MFRKNINQVLVAFTGVLILIVISIAVIAKMHPVTSAAKNISISYDTINYIKVDNSLPISDKLGKNISPDSYDNNKRYVSFEINNPNNEDVEYEIFLTKKKKISNLKENYVKLFLSNDKNLAYSGFDNNKIPTYDELLYLKDKPDSKLLYAGSISANSKDKFILRAWVSDTYALSDLKENFYFDVSVRKK